MELFPIDFPPGCVDTDRENVLVSFSAGRTSAYMCKRMKESPYWSKKNLLFVFANTGKEREETLEFADQCDKAFGLNLVWVEAAVDPEKGEGTTFRVVNFKTASRKGEPFEDVIKKYGITNKAFPHCNRELKLRPIQAYAKQHFKGPYVSAIGIRFDELRRVKPSPDKVYPLVGWQVVVAMVRIFWNSQCFDLKLKDYEGNCDLCWKKSERKILTLLKEAPERADWWLEMQEKYSNVQRGGEVPPPYYFYRGNESIIELLKRSKLPFVPASDPFWREDRNESMDTESACACMSEDEDETL